MNFNKAQFIKSAARPDDFLPLELPRAVLAGRSNVGKSSVINALAFRKKLAYVGNTPGKTSHVNYFLIDDSLLLVDLPGYGYSRRSGAEKERWSELMEAYFRQKRPDRLGILVVDIRHEPTALDAQMAGVFKNAQSPWLVVANKSDKLKPSQLAGSLEVIRQTLELEPSVPLIAFSAVKRSGREEIIKCIENEISDR